LGGIQSLFDLARQVSDHAAQTVAHSCGGAFLAFPFIHQRGASAKTLKAAGRTSATSG
jgi:hypothetical protein